MAINDDPSTTSYLLSLRDGFPIIYELGPAELTGNDIDDALAVYPQNEWVVQLNFKEIYNRLNEMKISTKFNSYNNGIKIIEKELKRKNLNFENKKIINYGQ